METPYTRALRDLEHVCGNLAGWMERDPKDYAGLYAIEYWSGRLTVAIARLDTAWEETMASRESTESKTIGDSDGK